MTKSLPFEDSLNGLEEIVKQLEKGELSLEESLKQFEAGIALARECQKLLTQAEQKIEVLTRSSTKTNEASDDE